MGYTRTGSRGYMSGSPGTITGNLTVTGTVSASEIEATSAGTLANPSLRLLDQSGNKLGIQAVSASNIGIVVNGARPLTMTASAAGWSASQNASLYSNSRGFTLKTASYTHGTSAYGAGPILHDATAGVMTATLPASPLDGQEYECQEAAGLTTAVTIQPNGKKINGVAATVDLTTAYGNYKLRYDSTSGSWYTR